MRKRYQNLIFLLADQFRHDAAGYAGASSAAFAPLTPHLDALAARGIAYTRAYTPLPVCAPARQALLCGQHPDSFGAFWNHGFFHTPPFCPEATFTQRLADNGRRGGYIGKWDACQTSTPRDFGFTNVCGRDVYSAEIAQKYGKIDYPGGWMGCESPLPLEDADTHFYARRAIDFVNNVPRDDGFFLWVDFGVPHLPCRPSACFAKLYDPAVIPPWPGFYDDFDGKPYCHRQQSLNWHLENVSWPDMAEQVARYFGMVSQLDDAVGLIVEALRAAGRLDDTLIVFTSDHGDMCGNHRMFDKHNTMYDDIVRVPLLLSGTGLTPGRSGALVSNCLDLPPTLCALMDVAALPDPHGIPLPLEGEHPRTHITSSSNGQQFGLFNTRMITDGRCKYVWNLTDTDEFYDSETDPGECVNRIHDPAVAGLVAEYRKLLFADLQAHHDPFAGSWLAPQLLEGRKA